MCVRPDSPKKIANVGLAFVINAAKQAGFKYELLDIDLYRYTAEEVEEKIKNSDCDVFAYGALSSLYGQVRNMASLIRKHHPNGKIIVGNTIATNSYDVLLNTTEVDICVLGEGELTIVNLFKVLEAGEDFTKASGIVFKNAEGKVVRNCGTPAYATLDEIPWLDYEVFEMDKYMESSRHHVPAPQKIPIPFESLRAIPINSARGCAFHCTFCNHAFEGYKYRTRTPRSLVDEIKHRINQYQVNFINFWDELTFCRWQDAEKFADIMIEENINVYWIASVRSELLVRAKDKAIEVAKKLKKAGCHGLAYSLETGNKEILKDMKKMNTVEDFLAMCEICHAAEIDIYTSIIIGYPQETPQTIDETFEVLRQAKVYPSVGFLQLMPGTPMYRIGLEKGLIKDEVEYLLKMGDRQDLRINLTQYDDEFLMSYTTEKLVKLNEELKIGLNNAKLIKTGTWQGKAKAQETTEERTDNFMEDFGISGKILRDSNFS